MAHRCSRRVPTAHVDPIDSQSDALEVLAIALTRPLTSQTLAILLDHELRGLSVLSVTGTVEPDALFDVLDACLALVPDVEYFGALVLASVRPDGTVESADLDRWLEASDQCELCGVELVEWFVVGTDITCPRDLLGEPPRWHQR